MFRFRLGSIPVDVHPSHLLVSAVLAYSSVRASQDGWPFRQVSEAPALGQASAMVVFVLSWMLIVFVSVLVHELGHALASRLFGYHPSIALVWLGGHTLPTDMPGPLPWKRDLVITVAGPLFGLLLGVVSLVGYLVFNGHSPALDFFLRTFAGANFIWAIFNLLPVLPLDGGRLVSTLATRVLGPRRGLLASQGLALLVCVAVVVYSLNIGWLFPAIFFAMYGVQAFRTVAEALSSGGNAPRVGAAGSLDSPVAGKLREAKIALDAGRLDDARRLGAAVLEGGDGLTPELASHAHHLLGWVALKEGQGRQALDHFSQVQGLQVEPHAVAASFSLVGDDARALDWWKQAWQTSSDRTVMHEYAGTLIRLGRTPEALKLPGVEAAAAFSCAERVLFIRGVYSEAAAMGEAALEHAPSASIAYDAACAYAKARNVPDAVRLLRRASELGFKDGAYAASDADLAPLHGHPAFEEWLTELRQSAAS
ncbi:site-2 protease family protein [Myxococcus sp. CA039A]|uniref:TPR end-of-group domain-containing protein n=1 Tax=Myxococcus sp. CA039A TaxID=2741737 RepID=UPI00157A4A37|nr:site-2 protease family protein [Myxococcus sp. CA039A]NTX54089.1 peptidase M50 [Myxococcus sp. CA039A]